MYLPSHFTESRVPVMHDLMRAYPLAAVVTTTAAGPAADHVPLEIDPAPAPYGTLRGHVARANPMWRERLPATPVLAIFQGPQAYVSPSAYATKRETGRVVPTWNYAVVHARCTLRAIGDPAWLRGLVERLTARHESDRSAPWQVTDAPPDYVDQLLRAIVGLELVVTELTGKWKASQNRPARDRAGVVEDLSRRGDDSAAAMARLVQAAADEL
ncbi:MAG: FMN-binding negative transcriptional regulator [Burkholderiales bacterium]|nr:FMN-binding negative transcriptional regulator [Burkholderiales bacterium]